MVRPYFLRPLTGALLGLVLSLFILSSGAVADPPAATYSFTILEVPGAVYTESRSINSSGQVAGAYYNSAGSHGFVYNNGTYTTFDVPGATNIRAISINDSGQVTGAYEDSSYKSHGFIATPMVTDIPTLSQWALLLGGGLLVGMAWLTQVRRTRPLRGSSST